MMDASLYCSEKEFACLEQMGDRWFSELGTSVLRLRMMDAFGFSKVWVRVSRGYGLSFRVFYGLGFRGLKGVL